MKGVYLDYAASTPVRQEVVDAMMPFFSEQFANPSALHAKGREVRKAVEDARNTVRKLLKADINDTLIFTSGGTESINLALRGVVASGDHIITTKIEHKAVLATCQFLEKNGVDVTYLDVDKDGFVSIEDIKDAIQSNTKLISVQYANNEVGVIQPIKEIGVVAKERNILFHTDACQVGSYLDVDVGEIGVDLMTLNGSKLYGPKGIGLLYVRGGVGVEPLLVGGGQEEGLRGGTENVPVIIGFARALELAQQEKEIESERLLKLRDYFVEAVRKRIEDISFNGSLEKRLPSNVNISFHGVDAETLLMYLDEYGIYASTGSACTSHEISVSHVLEALGNTEAAKSAIRFTLGKDTTQEDIDYVVEVLEKVVSSLRKV